MNWTRITSIHFPQYPTNNHLPPTIQIMEVWLFALAIILAVAVTIFFSYLFVSHYISKVERTKLVITVCTLSITVALLSLMLVPIDVFSVSSSLTGTGEQTNPGDVSKSGEAMKVFYYIFYITALALAFIIMPFAYFFHEEDDGEVRIPPLSSVCHSHDMVSSEVTQNSVSHDIFVARYFCLLLPSNISPFLILCIYRIPLVVHSVPSSSHLYF